jgi:poly-gamma-glutamate synthesis protein (capsule biosynthesis protein)
MSLRNSSTTLVVFLLAAASVAAAGLAVGWYRVPTPAPALEGAAAAPGEPAKEYTENVPIYPHGDQSKDFFDGALSRSAGVMASSYLPSEQPRSAIVAHHLLVADRIAEVFWHLSDGSGRTVVILSPNHFGVGRSPAQVSIGSWTTPYGTVASDIDAVHRLTADVPALKEEEAAFAHEHGVGVLTPFISASFAQSRIVPILLEDSLSVEDRRALAAAIAKELPDATVLASIDMSHYLPSTAADFHDALTLRRIEAGGCDGCTTGVEIDANAVLDVLLEVNALRGDQTWNLTHHGNSLKMLASDVWQKNTSHILGYFTKGQPTPQPHAALTFVGDIMLGRSVHDNIDKNGVSFPWSEVERFLSGTHLVVANLEGTVGDRPDKHTDLPPFAFSFLPSAVAEAAKHVDAVSLANNHIRDYGVDGEKETRTQLEKIDLPWFGSFASPAPVLEETVNGLPITLIGYHAFAPDEKTLLASITDAHTKGRTVIVMPHWGTEYETMPSEPQHALAKRMVAAGADLIVGGHPHVVQTVENVDGVPVVYSLGNFVFDQPNPATRNALALGVIIEPGKITLSFLPVVAKADGQPEPMADSAAKTMLADLAACSSEGWKQGISSGTLTLDRVSR